MEQNFWEHGTSVKVNFGEHLNLFLRNKGITENFYREQGNMQPPPPGGPSISENRRCTSRLNVNFLAEAYVFASTLRTSTRKALPAVRQTFLLNMGVPVYRVVLDELRFIYRTRYRLF